MNIRLHKDKFFESPTGRFIYKYSGPLLFIIALVIGVLTYDSYGLSWDDPMQRGTGTVNYNYIFHNDESLLTWSDRDYGPAYEILLILGEKKLGLTDTHDIYFFRHLTTYILFLIGALFCFFLVDLLYKNKTLAALAFLMIVLHPRLYAHSFVNTKDIPFLAMFFVAFYFLALAFRRKRIIYFVLLGISVGITVNLRIMGIMLLGIVPAFLVLDMIIEKRWKRNGIYLLTFLTSSLLAVYAAWPFLWPAPIDNFLEAFDNMRKFRWVGNVLLNGEMVRADSLPWYYLPEWFAITTPILFLILGIAGGALVILGLIKRPIEYLKNTETRNNLAYASCFLAPFLAVIYFESVVYDGWRQVFFVYAGFVMLMIFTLHKLAALKWLKGITYLTILYLIGVSVYYFPYQNVYFNSFLEFKESEYIRRHFEMDYWGISNLEALRYILESDTSDVINVGSLNVTSVINVALLKPEERARLNMTFSNPDRSKDDYYITTYRGHLENHLEYWGKDVYNIRRGRNTICTVYKVKP